MHFTSNNLLHNFPNGKYMLFFFYIYKKKKWKYGSTRPNPTWNLQPEPVLTHLKWLVFNPWPIWPITWLTWSDPTRLFCHASFLFFVRSWWHLFLSSVSTCLTKSMNGENIYIYLLMWPTMSILNNQTLPYNLLDRHKFE